MSERSEAKAQDEPSMEEILSSIRKIIATDEEGGEQSRTSGGEAGEEVLELTEVVAEGAQEDDMAKDPETKAPSLEELEREAEAQAAETEARLELAADPGEEEPAAPEKEPAAPAAEPELVSAATAAAATSAFAKLARAVAPRESEAAGEPAGQTVEAFLAELLRPMLKEWLDAHLPAIVERVVEREVKKLARRAELM